MIWGKSCNLAWLVAFAAGYMLTLCPITAASQNKAESPPPKPVAKQQKDETKPAEKKPKTEAAGNVAEKSTTKDEQDEAGSKEKPEKPVDAKPTDDASKPKDEKPSTLADSSSDKESQSAESDAKSNEDISSSEEKPDPSKVGSEDSSSETTQGSVAQTTPAKPVEAGEGETTTLPDGNIAEAVSTTTDSPANSSNPPPLIDPPTTVPANSAENRPTATSAQNNAEAGFIEDDSEIAEPPDPHFSLPSPTDVAGSVVDYVTPADELLESPALEDAPDRLMNDAFYQPNLSYLDRRPLPDIDIEETSEEEIARSFEESLKLLNLAQESRQSEAIQVPLPSGVMTFKASDAFEFDRRNKVLKFVGNAELVFDTIAIWADLIEVDDGAATAYAKGYVGIQEKDEILFCDEAYLNYDTKTLELFWVEGNTGGPRIEGAVFFEADRAYGSFDNMQMENVKVTTCEPYCGGPTEMHMKAEKMRYRRGESVMLINTYLYARNQKYFYIPMLAFPLDRSQPIKQGESDLNQNYGYNRSHGWFAKFAYTYSVRYAENVNRALLGVARVELSEKQGTGFGIRQDFLVPSLGVATVVGFYQRGWPDIPVRRLFFHPMEPNIGILSKQDNDSGYESADDKLPVNFEFSLSQELNLSKSLTGRLNVSRKDKITPARTQYGNDQRLNNWNNSLSLNYGKNDTTSSISVNQTVNITGGYTRDDGTQEPSRETATSNAGIRYNTSITKDLKFNVSQDFNSSKGNSGNQNLPADQEGTLRMGFNWTGKRDTEMEGYTASLGYVEQGIDYDGDDNTTDSNRTIRKEMPSLQIKLPMDLFNDGAYFNNFTINIDNLVTGRRRTPESSFRGKVTVSGRDNVEFSKSSRLTTSMNANQYWYDDGNAQYSLQPRVGYTYNPKSWWSFSSSWDMLYHQGVKLPPVQGDRKTYSNRINGNFTISNYRTWQWKLGTGYDFRNHSSYPLSSRFSWDPNSTFGLSQSMTYNLRDHTFSPSRMSGYFRSPYVDENGYYNWLLKATWDHDIEHQLRTTRLDLRWLKRWKNGWTSDVQGSFKDGSGKPPPRFGTDFLQELAFEGFSRDFIKRIAVRKTNCCTTVEGIWRTGINEFEVNVYLNALPQYPLREKSSHTFGKKWQDEMFFPINDLQEDILREQFGITQKLF